jgi:hypothetical protein
LLFCCSWFCLSLSAFRRNWFGFSELFLIHQPQGQ